MNTRPTRPVLAGNNAAAIRVLDLLLEEWDPSDVLVIAPPGGRHHGWQPSLAEAASERGVVALEPEHVNATSMVKHLLGHSCDLLMSVFYTQIFGPELLSSVDGPALNFHPSLLPRHRGTAPLIWAIVEGDVWTGLSVHELTEGVDHGPIVLQRRLPIHPDDSGFTLHQKMENLVTASAATLIRSLRAGDGLPEARPQSGTASRHLSTDPQINEVQWRDDSERIRNVVRAVASPLPGAFTMWRGRRIGLERIDIERAGNGKRRTPGMVDVTDEAVRVWAADAPMSVGQVRIDARIAPAADWVALGLEDGEVLG